MSVDIAFEVSDQAIESLVRRHRELGAQIAELKEEQEKIRSMVDFAVPVGWKLSVDGVTAHKREPNRSFDLVTAVSLLDADTKATCVTTGFDPKLVRAAVEDAGLIDACMLVAPDRAAVIRL